MVAENTLLTTGPDGTVRCTWGSSDELYRHYHDHEWGQFRRRRPPAVEKVCLRVSSPACRG